MANLLLYGIFFLSGVAGLIYETIWSRYLGLFLGHSAYAQVIVLVIFLGGLAVGALLVGRWSERVASPLQAYAAIELGVGVLGLVFHGIYEGVTGWAYDAVLPGLGGTAVVTAVKWVLAAGMILPPSVALGATFPLMTSAFLRLTPSRPGRVVALLYFVNSLGGAAGALFTGFILIAMAGLPGALIFAAILNLVAALVAFLIAGRADRPAPVRRGEEVADALSWRLAPERATLWRVMLAVSFVTAAASFIYEVSWIRMLSLVLGSATHSFELMLSAFILGLALGSLWIHRRADGLERPERALGVVQWLMGFAALATLPLYIASFDWTAALLDTVGRTREGYVAFTAARYGIALAVMLPSTFCAGITLPLITRILIGARAGERAVGWVYGLNTLGSIVGVVVAALLLLPLIGLKALLIFGATVDMGLGVWLLARSRERVAVGGAEPAREPGAAGGGSDRPGVGPDLLGRLRGAPAPVAAVVTLLLAGGALVGARLDRALLVSGVFRTGSVPEGTGGPEVLYYQDGRTATVAVTQDEGLRILSTNGKGDASLSTRWLDPEAVGRLPLRHDESTQILLALLSLAYNPDAATAAVVGHGSGVTSHMLLGSRRLERVVTMEIEPAMIEGSRRFYPANARVFDDPRSAFVIDDARSALSADAGRYDVIVSEPSNPWVSGVAGLFTVEFYRRVRSHMAPGGVFGQWLHLYEISDPLVLSVLGAVHRVFPSYDLYLLNGWDVLLVASDTRLPTPDWSVFDAPDIRASLERTYPFLPAYLDATRLANRPALRPLLEREAVPNSDYYPVLALGAEEARMRGLRSSLAGLADRFSPASFFLPDRPVPASPSPAPVPDQPAMAALARAARVRAFLDAGLGPDTTSAEAAAVAGEAYRIQRFRHQLDAGEAPADWRAWLSDLVEVDALVNGAAIGRGRTDHFDNAHAFAQRHDAPAAIMAGVRLLRALTVRDLEAAAAALDPIVERAEAGLAVLDPSLIRQVGVIVELATGDVSGARRVFDAMARYAGDRSTIAHRMVRAHLEAAGR